MISTSFNWHQEAGYHVCIFHEQTTLSSGEVKSLPSVKIKAVAKDFHGKRSPFFKEGHAFGEKDNEKVDEIVKALNSFHDYNLDIGFSGPVPPPALGEFQASAGFE